MKDADLSAKTKKQSYWLKQIETYESKFGAWEKRSEKIVDRYLDERGTDDKKAARLNILWSNVQTLAPALYANLPVPNIERRFLDDDDLGLAASVCLERAVSYFIEQDEFDYAMKQSVLDRLLSGRGTIWLRYVPVMRPVEVLGPQDEEAGALDTDSSAEEVQDPPAEEVAYEEVRVEYVHWKDFGHTWGRTWEEVRAVWRRVYLDKDEIAERFGDEIAQKISLSDERMGEKGTGEKKAEIYEIWDKLRKKVYWLHKSADDLLGEKDDFLGLKAFFPCPKPLYATLGNDSLIPTPDYVQYQDQAYELDQLTARIDCITKAVKVAGVYDARAEGVQRMLSEGPENKLVPVEQWAIFGEKGGLKGAIDFFPVGEIVSVLVSLYEAREKVKQDLYEITGISDIIRGATKANETATAQQIKGQFATLRLDSMQKDVARFSRDLIRIMAEIIAEHFSEETIKQISGLKLLTDEEKQMVMIRQQMAQQAQQALQQAQAAGLPPESPIVMNAQMAAQQGEIPEETLKLMDKPSWGDVMGLISNDMARCFRIDIETDSTIKADQEAEKASRIEFLTAASQFIQQAQTVEDPMLQPLLMNMLMFGVRGFKVGRELESEFKAVLEQIKDRANNPQPQGNPEAEMQQAEAAIREKELQAELAIKDKEIQLKQLDLEIKKLDAQAKLQSAMITAQKPAEQPYV